MIDLAQLEIPEPGILEQLPTVLGDQPGVEMFGGVELVRDDPVVLEPLDRPEHFRTTESGVLALFLDDLFVQLQEGVALVGGHAVRHDDGDQGVVELLLAGDHLLRGWAVEQRRRLVQQVLSRCAIEPAMNMGHRVEAGSVFSRSARKRPRLSP